MILCLLVAFIGTAFIVAYVGVSSMGAAWFSNSPTMSTMNATVWSAAASNTWAGMGVATVFMIVIVGGIICLTVYLLLPKTEKEKKPNAE